MSDNIRNYDLAYEKIGITEVNNSLKDLKERFKDFLEQFKYPSDLQYFISDGDLIEAIVRVDKREAYYYCFHNMEIHERKTVALYVYWILRFRPFTIIDARFKNKKSGRCVNELFAIYMISSILLYNGVDIDKTFEKAFYKKLLYSFRFRNFSIESLMLLVEAITAETFDIEYDEIV